MARLSENVVLSIRWYLNSFVKRCACFHAGRASRANLVLEGMPQSSEIR